MAFLTLTSDIQQPFVIPNFSPVSPAASRKNSAASVETETQLPVGRKGSISLL
ncbi:Spo24p TDEL_0C03170 [Torulaspora delbrueckii]|uniref:Uncharacterized protein n=1 Tax=Torulaspora delbrueckii TaxID=4950 RepID=G8ZRR4_TORDE|nr:hypothetical protein TDEL_0C03170 [Torulaspora delbrueckii]CCE91206.1 hypothetical protein TDEL_0C03170 [Torulaspora delbrueckii]